MDIDTNTVTHTHTLTQLQSASQLSIFEKKYKHSQIHNDNTLKAAAAVAAIN